MNNIPRYINRDIKKNFELLKKEQRYIRQWILHDFAWRPDSLYIREQAIYKFFCSDFRECIFGPQSGAVHLVDDGAVVRLNLFADRFRLQAAFHIAVQIVGLHFAEEGLRFSAAVVEHFPDQFVAFHSSSPRFRPGQSLTHPSPHKNGYLRKYSGSRFLLPPEYR